MNAYREASPTPFTLGLEVAGTITALGAGVTSVQIGAAVHATPGAGGHAQYISVPAAIAAASTPEKRAIAERLGADASIDYTAPN